MQIVGRLRWRLASVPALVVDTGLVLLLVGSELAGLNRPGFRALLPSWEGWRDAEKV